MTLTIHWPQAIMIGLYLFVLIANAVLHGKPRTGKFNFWTTLLGALVGCSVLYAGGFFGPQP